MATQLATPTAPPSPIPTTRPDTPARWQAALHRARAERISVRQVAGSGGWIATSKTDSLVAYALTTHTCECQAGEFGDPVCLHRALLRYLLGWMDDEPDPEPEPPAPVAAVVILRQPETPCPACKGDGWWYGSDRDARYTTITCGTCHGTGVDPKTLIVA